MEILLQEQWMVTGVKGGVAFIPAYPSSKVGNLFSA